MNVPARLKKLSHVDPVLFVSTFGLLAVGMVMVYSASSLIGMERHGDSAYYVKRHILFASLGLAAMGVLFFVNIRGLKKLAWPSMILCGSALVLTAATSLGASAKAATRWLSLGGFTVQPSELVKPVLVLYVASYLAQKGDEVQDFRRGLLPLLLTIGGFLLLILKQPDFGTCVVISLTVFAMLFVGRAKLWHLAALALSGVVAGSALMMGAAYRRNRILAFLDPWQDPQGKGFQIIQSFVAFQRGGFSGQGLGDGVQKLLYLPEAHTDFIYSVVAEELGFVGSTLVVLLFALLVIRGMQLALRIREPFAYQLAFGLTMLIGLQAFLNIAVVMGLVPTKGLTLPLISYGGSSLISTLTALGILFSLFSTVTVSKKMARRVVTA